MSLGDAEKPPVEGSHCNRAGKNRMAESAQLAPEDEELEYMIAIYTSPAISNNHEHKDGIDNPKSYKAAKKSPLAGNTDTAMHETLYGICQHQVFGDFVKITEGRNAFPSHWVYKIKCDGAGNVQRFKARLVCGGNHQIEGINFQARYAPTASSAYNRLAHTLATKYDLEIHQIDISTAFLRV
jgi:hypothetical protein